MLKLFTLAAAILVWPAATRMVQKDQAPFTKPKPFHYQPALLSLQANHPKPVGETDTNALKQSGWYGEAMKKIAQQEYEFKPAADPGTYITPNRRNNLQFTYSEKGFTVKPLIANRPVGKKAIIKDLNKIKAPLQPAWQVAFNLDQQQVGAGKWQIAGNKAEYSTDNITVQYLNNEQGMRQNFIVRSAPVHNEDVMVRLHIETALKTQLRQKGLLFSNKQEVVLSYDQLKVWDANGQPLEAFFEKSNRDYCIHVQSKNAAYPITIDPISSYRVTAVIGTTTSAYLGCAVSSAGDVNGDGYSDVIVGAYGYGNGQNSEGAVFIYHGSNNGINTTPAATMESNIAYAYLGYSVGNAGDINGDGYGDVIAGAVNNNNGETSEGAAYIYYGSPSGINTTPTILEKNQTGAFMGSAVATAGDVNRDGYSDVIVGAYSYDNGQTNEGVAFIYYGSPAGLTTASVATLESNQAGAYMGYSVACAGDVNGDGYSDVIVGAAQYGSAAQGAFFVFPGAATGINTTAQTMVTGTIAAGALGTSVSGAGDVNGDGFSDVIVGAPDATNTYNIASAGLTYVYYGAASGLNTNTSTRLDIDFATTVTDFNFGQSVASAGDVNGDGYSDVIIGAPGYGDNTIGRAGAWFIYLGAATGLRTSISEQYRETNYNAGMGYSVAGLGNVSGDGYSCVMAGAPFFSAGQTAEGIGYFLSSYYTPFIMNTRDHNVESNQANANFGYAVAGAGDVNGDGYSDVIIGAPAYDNGQTDEGAAFIHYGNNEGISMHNNLRVYNTDLTTPISSVNWPSDYFGVGLFTKSFLGRTKGKLVWETKLNYQPYSGNPITYSISYTSAQGSYTDLGTAGVELKSLVTKQPGGRYTKVRARVKYDAVNAINGQVYGPWRYSPDVLLTTSLGALPVDLISFNAQWLQKGKTAQLKFATDNESQICCYEIEKSANGAVFTTIGTVTATNTGSRYNYSFIDYDATATKQYYRIKIVFENGHTEYSNLQLLQTTTTGTEIIVFPNPATDAITIRLNTATSNMNVQLINTAGQVVQQLNSLSTAAGQITIPINNLANGTYFLHLQNRTEQQTLQFIKQ